MTEIDQDLYSRQIYVLGNQAMLKLTKSNVLLHGLGSLGAEIAKNLVLAGIGSLTILESKSSDIIDLGSQFFIRDDHIAKGLSRGAASLNELQNLNPHVTIKLIESSFESITDLSSFLKQFSVCIVTDLHDSELLVKVNDTCRDNDVRFICGDVYGLFGYSFTDFGARFQVLDADGEEYKSVFISTLRIDSNNEALIEVIDQKPHNLEVNDLISLSELKTDTDSSDLAELLNHLTSTELRVVQVINSYSFKIELPKTVQLPSTVLKCGMFKKVKKTEHIEFRSLKQELDEPSLLFSDLSEEKFTYPYLAHILVASYLDLKENSSLQEFREIVAIKSDKFKSNLKESELDLLKKLTSMFYYGSKAKFPPLAAFYGGTLAQEALKSVTNKFIPIKQWLYLDCSELSEHNDTVDYYKLKRNDRFDCLRVCFGGEATLNKLLKTKLFMVGCGAIGCEMLKNYAMLGIGCDSEGQITITDNDLIEKSNLSRQFLFRHGDIHKAKSSTAAKAVLDRINSKMNIKSYEHKVGPQTELTVFTDQFFKEQHLCINALDNLEARRYMDTRCVTTQTPLLESGTLGAKAHCQVIIPHLTESYNSQKDPDTDESQIPYCTLKSFPANIEHCIQWSRDKFESLFKVKPMLLDKFLAEFNNGEKQKLEELAASLDEELTIKYGKVIKYLSNNYCLTWSDCLRSARIKFEKYFANKARDLLHAYPLEHKMNDGSLFWKLPKRPPTPVSFNPNDNLHLEFVTSLARLYALVFNVEPSLVDHNKTKEILIESDKQVPEWRPRKKHIETDETKKKEEAETQNGSSTTNSKELTPAECGALLSAFLKKCSQIQKPKWIEFEKDDDQNGHVDFTYASANLRALMYSIEQSDKMMVKKIAGKIVPAIATTTSSVAGLVSIELVKLVKHYDQIKTNDHHKSNILGLYRNAFLNLGISLFLLSEPGACPRSHIHQDLYVTIWDKWTVRGNESFTLKKLIDEIKQRYSLTVSRVMHGSKSVYLPVMPAHAKRLNEKMSKLVKSTNDQQNYVDLFITYAECDENDRNNLCPPIRYYFS